MATFGAKHPCFAPFAGEETSTALPSYEGGVVIGPLVSANLTVALASGEIYGDDIKQEQMNEFASGSLPLETVDIEDTVKAKIYGLTPGEDGELGYGANDEAPYGGVAYYKTLLRKGKKLYRAYFYPKAQAAIGNDNASTRGSSITFQTDTTTFTILPPLFPDGKWRYEKTCATEAEAIAWIEGKLNMAQVTPPQEEPEG